VAKVFDNLAIPEVEVVSGFQIRCGHPNCGVIGFEKKRVAAEEKKAMHRRSHEEHEKSIREHLKAIQGEENDLAVLGIPLTPQLHCPACLVGIGDAHPVACDVARCLVTGGQRRLRSHVTDDPRHQEEGYVHQCGADIWTGYYPGEREASKYGVPLDTLKREGHWDAEKWEWVLPDDWAEKVVERQMQQEG
jgi:hypothetical protein